MLFPSIPFLFFFLPLSLGIYYASPRQARNGVLLVASLIFYFWGAGKWTAVLVASIAINWLLGLLAERWKQLASGDEARDVRLRRWVIGLCFVLNLGLLGYFKYWDFLWGQWHALLLLAGHTQTWRQTAGVLLPLGISFYTFHSISYVIDVARGKANAQKNPIDFALYILLFPQLIAGPIIRYHWIENQLRQRAHTWERFARGMVRFAWGLSKKVLIADTVAPLAVQAFTPVNTPYGIPLSADIAWIGMLAYTVQIYFDFSGYSDMAIGLGRLFGFEFPENFSRPYVATSVTDFWRRWHITLSEWFKNYVYIPLGGNRGSVWATYRNLLFVFLMTGLWHGANWTFVVWGLWHGLWLILERSLGWRGEETLSGLKYVIRRILTLAIVMSGWVLFRCDSLGHAGAYFAQLFTGQWEYAAFDGYGWDVILALMIGLLLLISSHAISIGQRFDVLHTRTSGWMRVGVVCVLFPYCVLQIVGGSFSSFLYFQF